MERSNECPTTLCSESETRPRDWQVTAQWVCWSQSLLSSVSAQGFAVSRLGVKRRAAGRVSPPGTGCKRRPIAAAGSWQTIFAGSRHIERLARIAPRDNPGGPREPWLMTEEIDIWRVANLLTKRRGEDAACVATQLADDCIARGDVDRAMIWKRILASILELQRTKLTVGERRN